MSSSSAASGSGHRTVMAEAAVAMLVTDPEATYVDATYGRGGHARRILQRLGNSGRLIALDRDPDAEADAASVADVRFQAGRGARRPFDIGHQRLADGPWRVLAPARRRGARIFAAAGRAARHADGSGPWSVGGSVAGPRRPGRSAASRARVRR